MAAMARLQRDATSSTHPLPLGRKSMVVLHQSSSAAMDTRHTPVTGGWGEAPVKAVVF